MSSTWSYSALVREHGEERALELLSEQSGYGEFKWMGGSSGDAHAQPDGRRDAALSSHCPLCGEPWSSRRPCGRPV